jgi:type II secretory pathway pseudopilin PulG
LAVLAAAVIAVVNPLEQFNKAQDSRRKSDLSQIQKALEVYYQDHHRYPYMYFDTSTNNSKISEDDPANDTNGIVEWGNSFKPYMDVLPIDPKNGKSYAYWTDATGQSYALYTSLDRGGRDPQACDGDNPCTGTKGTGPSGANISCGKSSAINCTYGVTSPNITP